ncbi:hypothetical protein ETD86_23765 [Nonomuraea turkmeniaca]|uniref:Ig-like domain-containing protein n=1 Tax=Nonomuraea turkmeniaca TaxID=103838 RepID=A0A5S4FEZ6_9ACTN|nr:hypothetical protein [Nonomuraea turkmeniaca]TMR17074.1 hypothetical protein ETD86_23765 [Nonomuraea turkmeniaca]
MNMAWIIAVATAAGPLSADAGSSLSPPGVGGARSPSAALTCAVTTPPGRPLVFRPWVGLAPRRAAVRGHLQLTDCTSPDGSAPGLRSGWVALRATAVLSCTSARRVHGRAVITWFGGDGRPVGTSTLRSRGDHLATQRPADALLTGAVTAGPLRGEQTHGGITPGTGLLSCATQGLERLPGAGHMTFG